MLIGDKKCKFMDKWNAFLLEKVTNKELHAISKDTWAIFYELVEKTNGELNKFIDDGEWPVLIDQFYGYVSLDVQLKSEQ